MSLVLFLGASPAVTNAAGIAPTTLSAAASAAFDDVSRCLTTGKTKKLDVYYLIDTSGSLIWTDPNNERQGILRGSIQQLGKFAEQGIQVQAAAGLFSSDATPALEWTVIESREKADQVAELASRVISNDFASGATDWGEGLKLAYKELNRQADSCRMLIWFTDGGINPDNTTEGKLASLSELCRPGITIEDLGSGTDFGLMSDFRAAQIPVFGILYNNVEAAKNYFQQKYPDEVEDYLAEERWSMSFMKALVEGRGEIAAETFYGETAVGGEIDCARVDEDGVAPVESVNGALLNASDPVALAFQFLKLSAKISGGAGSVIQDGKFRIPPGTAKFRILVNGKQWQLTGPEDSAIAANTSTPHQSVISEESAGATSIDVTVIDNKSALGEWAIDTAGANAELFLFPGLTFALDRDATSKILSGYPNTLTGRVVRTAEFQAFPVDLSEFEEFQVGLSFLSNGQRVPFVGAEVEIAPSGEFAVTNLQPADDAEELELWLTLDLGPNFNPVESKFLLDVQDKAAMVSASTDNLKLSNLVGPEGVARGTLILQGPNTADESTFCFASLARLDDTQSGIEKVSRAEQFSWEFRAVGTGESGDCFTVARDEVQEIEISARNPVQADSAVVAVWTITADSPSVGVKFEAPLRISFDSETQSNTAVTWIVFGLLLILGLLLPLLILWLLNFLTTRFLPVEAATRMSIPVLLDTSGRVLKVTDGRPGKDGPIEIEPRDFLNVPDQAAPKNFDTGFGQAMSKVPLFPLASTWYEWHAPEGSRVVTSYLAATKSTKDIAAGRAAEVSPNIRENWALTISDSELAKTEPGPIRGQLTVFAPMLPLAGYQAKVATLLASNGLSERINNLKGLVKSDIETKSKGKKDDEPPLPATPSTPLPPMPPGFGSKAGSGVPPAPGIPGSMPPTSPGSQRPPGPPPIS